jgi:hypothetical protein
VGGPSGRLVARRSNPDVTVVPFDSVTVNVSVAFTTAPFAAPSWTDISAYVMSADITPGGRQTSFDQFSAGTLRVQLNGSDRRFDPVHASGAYQPNVRPRKKIKVEVTYNAITYPKFMGFVDGWPNIGEPSNNLGIVQVTATDGFKMLAKNRLPIDPTNPVGDGETVTARIGRLLDYAGWPAADRDIDTNSPTLVHLIPNGQPVMDELYTAANADLGQIFIAPDGKFTYRGHAWQLANNLTSSATLGENPGEIGYNQITFSYDDTQIFNRAKGQANVGLSGFEVATIIDVEDATSITAYGASD